MRDFFLETERLILRNWRAEDLASMAAINQDAEGMRYFPRTYSYKERAGFLERCKSHFKENKYTYFAVELKATQELIGFTGLAMQTFSSPFTPNVDMGWRLAKAHWGKAYAPEAAQVCLAYGFEKLKLPVIIAIASSINLPSIRVMEKIKMKRLGEFTHPKMAQFPSLASCTAYGMDIESHKN